MISIRPFTAGDLPEVLKISEGHFGKNYLTSDDFSNHTSHVAVHEGQVVGFCTYLTFTRLEFPILFEHLASNGYRANELDGKLIILKSIAMHNDFTGRGIGRELVTAGLSTYPKDAPLISINWSHGNDSAMEKISSKIGLEFLMKIEDFWREESLKRKFDCAVCGRPPCSCSANIYGNIKSSQFIELSHQG